MRPRQRPVRGERPTHAAAERLRGADERGEAREGDVRELDAQLAHRARRHAARELDRLALAQAEMRALDEYAVARPPQQHRAVGLDLEKRPIERGGLDAVAVEAGAARAQLHAAQLQALGAQLARLELEHAVGRAPGAGESELRVRLSARVGGHDRAERGEIRDVEVRVQRGDALEIATAVRLQVRRARAQLRAVEPPLSGVVDPAQLAARDRESPDPRLRERE
jgi:hypothetical protein